ncbi:MAG: SIS domain-containing protein [Parcubacteria group bacterium]
MNILDDVKKLRYFDRQNVLGSINALPDQVTHAWRESRRVRFPSKYSRAKKIIVAGMGGSMIGTHLIESVFASDFKVPLVRVGDYRLPIWAGRDTLIILSSYSGTTEEVLAVAKEAFKRGCLVTGLTVGASLGRTLHSHRVPYYKIIPSYNPSNQPRMATGYMVAGLLGLLSRCNLVHISEDDMRKIVELLARSRRTWGADIPMGRNKAKQLAKRLLGRMIFFAAAEHLVGNAHIAANQVNENAKAFATYFPIPELNHHLLEALRFPRTNRHELIGVFFNSQHYHQRNQRRITATKRILVRQRINSIIIQASGPTRFAEALRIAHFGAYAGFYLAMLYRINPAPIVWVDAFKKIMAKR